jgi:hypothetical protein
MANLIPLTDFQLNYEVKNGYIADAATLNLAVDAVQQEMIALWQFVTEDVIASGDKLIDDTIGKTSNIHVRSINGLHNEVFRGGTWS